MGAPYVTFVTTEGKETFYLPGRTDVERYARELAPSIHAQSRRLRMAYVNDEFTVLVPLNDFGDERDLAEIASARIMGYPMKVLSDLDEPMIAFNLKRTAMP